MALKLTLKPHERVVINGCVIRNADRRQVLMIESRADVVREHELLDDKQATTPATRCYYMIQTALIRPDAREGMSKKIHKALAEMVPVFRPEIAAKLFEAAGNVSINNYYKAMRALRPVIEHESAVFAHIAEKNAEFAAQQAAEPLQDEPQDAVSPGAETGPAKD